MSTTVRSFVNRYAHDALNRRGEEKRGEERRGGRCDTERDKDRGR